MLYALAVFLLVGLDQLSKFLVKVNMPVGSSQNLVPGILQLTYVRNTGAAFSIFQGMRWALVIITVIVTLCLIILIARKKVTHPFGVWSLVVILGGAYGNLIDRVLYGSVVDMFEFTFIRFAVFNVADVFVVFGGIAFCIYFLKFHELQSHTPSPVPEDPDGEDIFDDED